MAKKTKYDLEEFHGFKDFIGMYNSNHTKNNYRTDIFEFFRMVKWRDPAEVKKLDAIQFVSYMREHGLAARSICRRFAAVKQYFNFLVGIEYVQKNPFVGTEIKLPKFDVDTTNRTFIPDDDLVRIFRYFANAERTERNLRNRAMICLMLYNGLRREEISKLDCGDLPIVEEDGQKIHAVRIHGKGDKERIRPIHPDARRATIEYLAARGVVTAKTSDPIFVRLRTKKRLSPIDVYKQVKMVVLDAGCTVTAISPHAFRAKFAIMSIENGSPLTSVQYDMGHANVGTTSIYDRAKSRMRRSSVSRIKSFTPSDTSSDVDETTKTPEVI